MPERKSLIKQLANQKNAQKSTGPKTAEGKARVAQNPRKHGVVSKEVVVRGGDGRERAADFVELLESLHAQFQPQDAVEQIPVDRVAACYWRLRRAQRYEVGAVRERLDDCRSTSNNPGPHTTKLFKRFENLESQLTLEQQSLRILSTPVEKLKDFERLRRETALSNAANTLKQPTLDLTDPAVMQEAVKACHIEIAAMERELEKCKSVEYEAADKYDALADSRRPLLAALPADEPLNRLIRYETMLDRQLHRALSELRRRRAWNKSQPLEEPGEQRAPDLPADPKVVPLLLSSGLAGAAPSVDQKPG